MNQNLLLNFVNNIFFVKPNAKCPEPAGFWHPQIETIVKLNKGREGKGGVEEEVLEVHS